MQLRLSGSIRRKLITKQPSDTEPQADQWICRLCGERNEPGGEESDPEMEDFGLCRRCRRSQHPRWLRTRPNEGQLDLGAIVVLINDSSPQVGVVAGLDYYTHQLELITIAYRASYRATGHTDGQREVASAGGRRSKYRFEVLTLSAAQIQTELSTAVPIDSTEHQELVAVLEQQGVCGDCRRLFRIAQGDTMEKDRGVEAIHAKQAEIWRCEELKAQSIRLKEYNKVLDCTATLRSLSQQLLLLKRRVEYLAVVACPHCGWIERSDSATAKGKIGQ